MTLSRCFRRPFGCGVAAVALAALLGTAPAAIAAAAQDHIRLGYAGFLGPVQVVAATVGLELSPGTVADGPYSMALDVRMTGPLEKLVPFQMRADSHGTSGDEGVRPASYSSSTRIYEDGRAMLLTYGADGSVDIAADPPTVEARHAREQGLATGTLDPLSAIVALVDQAIRTGACSGRVPVFDGTRRFDLVASPAGTSRVTRIGASLYEGQATECAVRPVLIGGFRQVDIDAGVYPEKATMWIASVVAGAPPVPVRVIGMSSLGNLRLDLVEAWAMDAAAAGAATSN